MSAKRIAGRYGLAFSLLLVFGLAQQTSAPPAFDAASVKPTPLNALGGPLSGITYAWFRNDRADLSCTVREVIAAAYGVPGSQVSFAKPLAGVMTSWYDIVGEAGGPATDEQLRQMLRTPLADRFRMSALTETRTVSGYALVVAKGGPRNLTPMVPLDPDHPSPDARGLTLAEFASVRLFADAQGYWVDGRRSGALPVVDETGIKGTYDLWPGPFGHAGFSPAAEPRQPGDEAEPLAFLLDQKLGLTLVKTTVAREFIVVTHIERPTPN